MMTLRPAAERGHADHGWLDTYHSFSFGHYRDAAHMGFRALRVINEDRVAPGQGFGPHTHRDMEILTYVLSGSLAHRDSLGNGSILRHGDIQRMTAGTGVRHSEMNASADEPVHLLQIWILPESEGLRPGYEEHHGDPADLRGTLRLIASRDGDAGALTIHQDVRIHAGILAGQNLTVPLAPGRHAWVQVAAGSLTVNGKALAAGDGLALSGEPSLCLEVADAAEILVFDLA